MFRSTDPAIADCSRDNRIAVARWRGTVLPIPSGQVIDLEVVIAGRSTADMHPSPVGFDDDCEYGFPESVLGIIVGMATNRLGVPLVVAQN